MSSPNDDGLQFAIDVLQKALVTKDDEINKMKHANQVQLYVLLNEIAKRDDENVELNDKIDSMELEMAQYKIRIKNLENEIKSIKKVNR